MPHNPDFIFNKSSVICTHFIWNRQKQQIWAAPPLQWIRNHIYKNQRPWWTLYAEYLSPIICFKSILAMTAWFYESSGFYVFLPDAAKLYLFLKTYLHTSKLKIFILATLVYSLSKKSYQSLFVYFFLFCFYVENKYIKKSTKSLAE